MESLVLISVPLNELEASIAKIVVEQLLLHCSNQSSQKEVKKYATRDEVAKMLHISKPTLNQLTKIGTLSAYRIGTRVLYNITEVEASLSSINTNKYKRAK